MILPTTLCLTAAAALINIWLMLRIARLRGSFKVSVGDGGHELLNRRMRAQSNFIEQTPITLILFAGVELAGKGGVWLAPLGAVFLLGRVAHAFGMDSQTSFKPGRPIGMLTSMGTQLGLVVVGVLISVGRI